MTQGSPKTRVSQMTKLTMLAIVIIVAIIVVGNVINMRAARTAPTPEPPVLKVSVGADGAITVNGLVVTPDILRVQLAALKARGGVVWYYRENPQGELPASALEVMKLIAEAGAPVRLSSKPDFSDDVDSTGVSRPREAPRP